MFPKTESFSKQVNFQPAKELPWHKGEGRSEHLTFSSARLCQYTGINLLLLQGKKDVAFLTAFVLVFSSPLAREAFFGSQAVSKVKENLG